MAVKDNTLDFPVVAGRDMAVVAWALAQGDEGKPVPLAAYADRTVQVVGIFGGASVALMGSNNGTDYETLTDPQGNALTFASKRMECVMELPLYVKPVATGGDGTTAINVILTGRKQ